ncbi:MAG: hypothetical protein QXD11_01650 [Candidatus Micrarchaeaceae archaeon]
MQDNDEEVRYPKGKEVVGVVTRIMGAGRFMVSCSDGKDRLCTIPGRFRRKFWIKINDVVLVEPWVVQGDEKGDIILRYSIMAANKLRMMKYLK